MDSTFFAFVGLILFLALIVYLKVPGLVGRSLDARSDKIKNDLEEARSLREEAQQLLAEYQRKRKEAEKEAEEIIASASREAAALKSEAERKMSEYVTRRTTLAEQKIQQAESQAVAEVRAASVDVAVQAAKSVIGAKLTGAAKTDVFKKSLAEVKARLN
ncbi:MAG: F0F1 ATP synthase subunit B [Pseudomonadota bacterium]